MDISHAIPVLHDLGGPIGVTGFRGLENRLCGMVLTNTTVGTLSSGFLKRQIANLFKSSLGRWMYGRWNFSLEIMATAAFGNGAEKGVKEKFLKYHKELFPTAEERILVLHRLASSLIQEDAFFREAEINFRAYSHLPIHLVFGEKDFAFGREHMNRLKAITPMASTHLFENSGHWPHVDRDGDYAQVLFEFAERLLP
jgi:pimeloyl-ACP methyl ester carboxylesterase